MEVIEKSLLTKKLKGFDAEFEFAVLFGSSRRGEDNAFSDIDIFIVCGDEDDKSLISKELAQLSLRFERGIHHTLFSLNEFNNRLRHHDYLLASILEDSSFLLGDRNCFLEGRQLILMNKPDESSISFNMNMGAKILGYARCYLNEFESLWMNSTRKNECCETNRELLLKGLQNYHIAIGYLLASVEMKKLNKSMSLKQLLTLQTGPLLEDLISIEKKVRRSDLTNLEVQNILFGMNSNFFLETVLGRDSAGNKRT